VIAFVQIVFRFFVDLVGLAVLSTKPRGSLEAEILVLRRQLAWYMERGVKPRRINAATRVSLAFLSRLCNWHACVIVVRPETVIRWHRAGWRLLWRYKSRPGRPRISQELRQWIRRMATDNPTWGEERIANELLVKLAIRVSPRTIRKYMPQRPPGKPRGDQRWSTFLSNHAQVIVACDFLVAVTATFRLLYVFVVIHHGWRRLLHFNVTAHPSAAWTLQQLREAIGAEDGHHYLLRDRDRMFAASLEESIPRLGLTVLKSPPRCPKANAICERLIGTIRRECLDAFTSASDLVGGHYNRKRPHMSLGPGVPDPPSISTPPQTPEPRHRIDAALVHAKSVLGGLGRLSSSVEISHLHFGTKMPLGVGATIPLGSRD
jgi:putative transposase